MIKMWLISCLYASLLVSAVYGAAAKPFFRKDYEFNADTQNFYKIHTATRTWTDAKARCQLEGAALFVPDSKQDQEAAAALVEKKKLAFANAWIGIHDQFSESDFVTIDGISIDEVYHEWDDWEPNNVNNDEDCVALKKNAKSNDENCAKSFPFICKKSRSTLQWNVLCDTPDPSYQYQRDLGKCYKIHLQPRTWQDAYGVCAAEQSYLTIVNSKVEADHLVKMVADAPNDNIKGNNVKTKVHIGIHNQLNEGFTTIHGVDVEDTGYDVWAVGQPDTAEGKAKCGSIFNDGTLNAIPCDDVSVFICERDLNVLSSSFEDRFQINEP